MHNKTKLIFYGIYSVSPSSASPIYNIYSYTEPGFSHHSACKVMIFISA